MIKVKDGYAKLIGSTYLGVIDQVLLSNGGNLTYSSANSNSTLVLRNDSGLIFATYFNTAIGDEKLADIGSVYVRNTSDNFIRRISKTLFYSILDGRYYTKTDSNNRYVGGNKLAGHGSSDTAYTPDTYSLKFANKAFVAFAERGSWNYAGNGYITTSLGINIHLAGTAVFQWGADDTYKTLLFITPGSSSGVSNSALNEMLFYTSNGDGYPANWTRVLTNRNYTNYINPVNYVTSLGTSGNLLTWTKNGKTNNITIPFATSADWLKGALITDLNVPTTWSDSGQRLRYDCYYKTAANNPISADNANGIITLFKDKHGQSNLYVSLLAFPNIDAIYFRHASAGTFTAWKRIAFTTDSLKNPYSLILQINGVTQTTYDGSDAKTFNINLNKYYDSTKSRTANTVLAAPNGSNGSATFRKLVINDIPNLPYSKIIDTTDPCIAYNYTNGVLVKINAVSSRDDMITVRIIGNSYGKNSPFDITIQFYNYNSGSSILEYKAINNGEFIGNIKAFNYDGKICIWFKLTSNFLTFFIRAYSHLNRILTCSASNSAMPASGVTREVTIVPKSSYTISGGTGKNVYSTSTPISILSGSPTIRREKAFNGIICNYGFTLVGDDTNKSSVRMKDVFTEAGTWTVSFEVRGSQSVAVGFDLKVGETLPIDNISRITTNNTNTWIKIIKSFNISDNFNLDFLNIAWAYIHIRYFKVEKGSATEFTPGELDMFHHVGEWNTDDYTYYWKGRYVSLRDKGSNPLLKLTLNSIDWYIQAYNNNLCLGTTYANSIKIDQNGRLISSSFIKSGGTSSLFLMADGSIKELSNIKVSWNNITEKPTIFPTNWANVVNKPTTIAGYGITDAYTHIKYLDKRSENLNPYGAWTYKGVLYSLKSNSTDGLSDGNTYHGSMTLHQWNDSSGGAVHQLGFTDNGNMWMRHGSSSWSGWRRFVFSDEVYGKTTSDSMYVNVTGDTMTGGLTINASGVMRRMLNDTSNCERGLSFISKDAGEVLASISYHNTVQKLYLNSVGSNAIYEDAVGKYSLAIGNNHLTYNTYKIWHAGNDGSGSGLDSDLLDGKHLTDILSSNVASATKLQTARTIWGQSFNGTLNVDGVFRELYPGTSYDTVVHSILNYPSSPFGLVTRINSNGVTSLQSQRENTTSEYFNLSLNPYGGNVGIGTASPSYKLDVAGGIRITESINLNQTSSSFDRGLIITGSKKTGFIYGTSEKRGIFDYTNSRWAFSIEMNGNTYLGGGNVGIGTTSPTLKLHIAGNVLANLFIKSGGTSSQFLMANGSILELATLNKGSSTHPVILFSGRVNNNSGTLTVMGYTGKKPSIDRNGPRVTFTLSNCCISSAIVLQASSNKFSSNTTSNVSGRSDGATWFNVFVNNTTSAIVLPMRLGNGANDSWDIYDGDWTGNKISSITVTLIGYEY